VTERRSLHPDLSPEERRRLFQEGIDLFNRGEHFLAHEAWEEIWRSTTPEPRELFQGLVQVAAALHQLLDLERTIGPRITFAKARSHLERQAPVACGLDLEGLLEAVGRWQEWLETDGERPPMPAIPAIRVIDPRAVS
jgi:predicted metal-dependent hydrolase